MQLVFVVLEVRGASHGVSYGDTRDFWAFLLSSLRQRCSQWLNVRRLTHILFFFLNDLQKQSMHKVVMRIIYMYT